MTGPDHRRRIRGRVAASAARLLYDGLTLEFKQAKEQAARKIGVTLKPSNLEVALELDKLAEEVEGPCRPARLEAMRRDSLWLMKLIEEFRPSLIGSVWRGTITRSSDIDIVAYSNDRMRVVENLRTSNVQIESLEWSSPPQFSGNGQGFLHMYAKTSGGFPAEIIVRPEDVDHAKEVCDIFRDYKRGLSIAELEDLLMKEPYRRFVPRGH